MHRWPRIVAVLEGQANAAADVQGVDVIRAEAAGDDAIVEQAARFAGSPVTVVTADRGLGERVRAGGADVLGPGRLLELLGS